jgi:peptide/nickel transport system substrate-binding protein
MGPYLKFRLGRWLRRTRNQRLGIERSPLLDLQLRLRVVWRQLLLIRKFMLVWILVAIIGLAGLLYQIKSLQGAFHRQVGLAGGTYSEAVVGTVKNINPVLPESSASSDASRLIFSGLTQSDNQGKLAADLAQSWTVSTDGRTYTFHLRKDVKWHDGVPFSAGDVVFTLAVIQNPDTRSPLAHVWQGVKAEAKDANTVVYTLPKPFSPFINDTTIGILPQHLLENVDPSSLRVADFNQKPVGTGPFKIDQFDQANGIIKLAANKNYYAGRPLLDGVILRAFPDFQQALDAYDHRQVLGVSRIQVGDFASATKQEDLQLRDLTVPEEAAVFFRTTSPVLSDKAVRGALAQATDRQAIVNGPEGRHALPLYSPLPPGPNNTATARQSSYDLGKANGQRLEIHLVTQTNSQYAPVAELIKKQWAKAGAQVDIKTVDAIMLQQTYIRSRNYDALLYGINAGADPDEYVYWDSSQSKDPGLNVSMYSSSAADKALESGRTLRAPALRSAKYKAFLTAWMQDTPAVMLYNPSYIYGVSRSVIGVGSQRLVNPSDRFYGIQNWAVHSRTVDY